MRNFWQSPQNRKTNCKKSEKLFNYLSVHHIYTCCGDSPSLPPPTSSLHKWSALRPRAAVKLRQRESCWGVISRSERQVASGKWQPTEVEWGMKWAGHGRRRYWMSMDVVNTNSCGIWVMAKFHFNFCIILCSLWTLRVPALWLLSLLCRDTHTLTHTQLFDFVVCGSVGGEVLIGRGSSEASNPQTTTATATMSMMSTVSRQKL